MNARNLFATLLVAVILLALFEAAKAQDPAATPASAASAAASLAATPDTKCGAAGTGIVWRYEPGATRRSKTLISRPEQGAKPGAWAKRVDASGEWVGCRMPVPPPDCVARSVREWGDGGRCKALTDPPGQAVILPAATIGKRRTLIDKDWRGRQEWECRAMIDAPAAWVPTGGYCAK